MKLVIDRSKWLRGEGSEESRLLREKDGKMCCLGFLGLQCGLREGEILEKESLLDSLGIARWPQTLIYHSHGVMTSTCLELMHSNDAEDYVYESDREKDLARLFKNINIDVEFIG